MRTLGVMPAAIAALAILATPTLAQANGNNNWWTNGPPCGWFGTKCQTILGTGPGKPIDHSTGPSPSIDSPCGVGYWDNPAPGICNIALSNDMNHGAVTTYTTGPSVLECQKTKGHGDWKKTWVVDGACVEKSMNW